MQVYSNVLVLYLNLILEFWLKIKFQIVSLWKWRLKFIRSFVLTLDFTLLFLWFFCKLGNKRLVIFCFRWTLCQIRNLWLTVNLFIIGFIKLTKFCLRWCSVMHSCFISTLSLSLLQNSFLLLLFLIVNFDHKSYRFKYPKFLKTKWCFALFCVICIASKNFNLFV